MTIEISSSQREMVHEQRPVMSADLFLAAMKGDEDVLIQRLGLPREGNEVMVTIETSHCAQVTEHQTVQFELQSQTHLGDTVLHLLVTARRNDLALKVFQRDMSLLKVRNKKLETPLYSAAKVGNKEVIQNLIRIDPAVVKDVLEETNKNGDTALHVAAKNGHIDVGLELMKLNPQVAEKVNNEMFTPLYIAIVNGCTEMVQAMLEVDPILACTQFSNEMFPVHVSAHMGNKKLVMHFMKEYPDDAALLDHHGRNLFHIAADENVEDCFWEVFKDTSIGERIESKGKYREYLTMKVFQNTCTIERIASKDTSIEKMIAAMNNAKDYEGNTPLHIAAMKGHKSIMRAIWAYKMNHVAEAVRNKQGLTPLELSKKQLIETNEDINDQWFRWYAETNDYKFTREWFEDVMAPPVKNTWEKTQVIGLGSVLIMTVTFAAALTIPGGHNQDNGTPVLGRRYMFRAFIIANALAFIQAFVSLFVLLSSAYKGIRDATLKLALTTFLLAAWSMVVAFGLGLYVTLAPISLPIASSFLLALCF